MHIKIEDYVNFRIRILSERKCRAGHKQKPLIRPKSGLSKHSPEKSSDNTRKPVFISSLQRVQTEPSRKDGQISHLSSL